MYTATERHTWCCYKVQRHTREAITHLIQPVSHWLLCVIGLDGILSKVAGELSWACRPFPLIKGGEDVISIGGLQYCEVSCKAIRQEVYSPALPRPPARHRCRGNRCSIGLLLCLSQYRSIPLPSSRPQSNRFYIEGEAL